MTGRVRALIGALLALGVLGGCKPDVTSLGIWRPDAGERDATIPVDGLDAAPRAEDAATIEAGQYIEAEAGELSGGFTSAADATASAGHYLSPPGAVVSDSAPGAARARYTFEVARAATYRIWGRIRGPDAEHNRFWFQVDGRDWHKWRLSTGDIWFWDAFHDDIDYGNPIAFELSAGTHTLVIANGTDGTGLDRLYVSEPGDVPVGNDTACKPPHSIERAGQCVQSCGSHGRTDCGGAACAGHPVIVAYDCAVCCLLDQ
jgi:hypothetical protein